MKEKSVVVSLGEGMDSRKAAAFVQEAVRFHSRIYCLMDNKQVNAKSIMGVLSMGLLDGDKVLFRADGPDEEEAIEELSALLQ